MYGDVGHCKSTLLRRLFGIYKRQNACEAVRVTNPDYLTALQLLKRLTDDHLITRFSENGNVLIRK
jgi:hypothetical protein